MKKVIFASFLPLLLAGCAVSRPDVSREDWKIRSYEGIDRQEILQAAREVIRLADPDDTIFETKPDGFRAARRQLSYYVVESGLDIFAFDFVVRATGGRLETRLDIEERIERANFVTLGLPVAEVGKPQSEYIYKLFYSRMDYLLGLNDRWLTCKESSGQEAGAAYGKAEELGLAAFCGRFASDLSPPPFAKRRKQ